MPVKWEGHGKEAVRHCSTHPLAPQGLSVLPGECDSKDEMSIVVENESVMPVAVSPQEVLAIGAPEEEVLSILDCQTTLKRQDDFCRAVDWSGGGQDKIKDIPSSKDDQEVVLIAHLVPRFTAVKADELGARWTGRQPLTRITTVAYQEGDLDYVIDQGEEITAEWTKGRPWTGQTVFTFAKQKERIEIADAASPESRKQRTRRGGQNVRNANARSRKELLQVLPATKETTTRLTAGNAKPPMCVGCGLPCSVKPYGFCAGCGGHLCKAACISPH